MLDVCGAWSRSSCSICAFEMLDVCGACPGSGLANAKPRCRREHRGADSGRCGDALDSVHGAPHSVGLDTPNLRIQSRSPRTDTSRLVRCASAQRITAGSVRPVRVEPPKCGLISTPDAHGLGDQEGHGIPTRGNSHKARVDGAQFDHPFHPAPKSALVAAGKSLDVTPAVDARPLSETAMRPGPAAGERKLAPIMAHHGGPVSTRVPRSVLGRRHR